MFARTVLGLLAILNFIPGTVALVPTLTERLYGFSVDGAALELAMRHRAVLLAAVGAFFALAAFRDEWWTPALLLGLISKTSFLVLFALTRPPDAPLRRVALGDLVALLAMGLVAALRRG